jgi:Peptidase propeptide and YPEB domain
MMKRIKTSTSGNVFLGVLALCLANGCAVTEKKVAVSAVPDIVLVQARQAVPGLTVTEAEAEETREGLVYELEGTADGKEYEIEVTSEGRVIEVAQEEADDGED